MEHDNGRRDNEDYSSSSDFYSESQPSKAAHNGSLVTMISPPQSKQPPLLPLRHDFEATVNTPDHHDADDEDEDDSDAMDLDSDSASSPVTEHRPSHHAGSKRKASDSVQSDDAAAPAQNDHAKKPKLSDPVVQAARVNYLASAGIKRGLSKELWQHVFLYLPPAMLARCLSVCRAFNTYLTESKGNSTVNKYILPVAAKDSEGIWTHSRKTFLPTNFPKPLPRHTELQMLQLVGGRICQFCDRELPRLHATDVFHRGPGPDGLRTIWPFALRTCGVCLEKNTVKDIDLLKSNAAPKDLRFGLPHIFFTPELHYIPASQRKLPGGIPPHLRANKLYSMRDLTTISTELEDAKSLGDGASEEWRKGLQARGNSHMNEASRWENWEATLPAGKDVAQVLREYDVTSFPRSIVQTQAQQWPVADFMSSARLPVSDIANGMNAMHQYHAPVFQGGYQPGFPYGQPFPGHNGLPQQQAQRPVKTLEDIMAVRQARQKSIERRCMALEPPVDPRVLEHCQAFHDAMQISQPMDDVSWENVLKPRLLGQREQAELLEHQKQEAAAALNAGFFAPGDLDFTKSGKELRDKEYEAMQQPLRKKLGEYAKELIDSKWDSGRLLDRDNCPAFAIDILLRVRKKYLQDKKAGRLSDLLESVEPVQGKAPVELFLSLDNMKWVYENKIRPLTDKLCKELFACAACVAEQKPLKWFAFEGLIQHYGAKHTSAFSRGNIVVQWESAEWPDEPPFFEHPLQLLTPEKKAHGRARNTPQAKRGPSNPPGPSKLLSENPLFAAHGLHAPSHRANGHDLPSEVESSYHYGSQRQSPVIAPVPSIDMSEIAQVTKLSGDAREIWDALEGVKDLLGCVRLQAAIHHSVKRFWERFQLMPNLDLLTDALASNAQILPVKNAAGLACQICVVERNPVYQSYYGRIQNVKLYATSPLVTHFKLVHQNGPVPPDWTHQMIELPERDLISELISAPGMNDDKLAILASAFPWAFPAVLPRIGLVQSSTPQAAPVPSIASRGHKKSKPQGKRKRGRAVSGTDTQGAGYSSESMHEYDPTRPDYLITQVKPNDIDPARFDTDLSRARESASNVNPIANVPPESLPPLNHFGSLHLEQQQTPQNDDNRERSPSVGRVESRNSVAQPSTIPITVQPDISAILAALAPHLQQPVQTSTPPHSIRSDSGPKIPVPHPYGHPPSGNLQEEQRPAARYSTHPTHLAPVEYSPNYTQQHQATSQARNMASYQHNQQVPTYVESAYPPASSPGQYQYMYEQGPTQHHQPVPVFREQPIQYIQLPPDARQSPAVSTPHYYDRPRPVRSIYVDTYGNPVELVPVDSAPAPIQYIPHPMEERQQRQYFAAAPPAASPPGSAPRAPPGYYDYSGR